ncbi:MAG: hypothetical protein KJZ83_06910 [Burkholderiaceae bacterium]|nr:hypothetical protein [Burkholderiaceae bacterium]
MSALDELRAIFASDAAPDGSRLRRLALIITMQMTDRSAAAALYADLDAAISLFEDDREAGRFTLEMLDHLL